MEIGSGSERPDALIRHVNKRTMVNQKAAHAPIMNKKRQAFGHKPLTASGTAFVVTTKRPDLRGTGVAGVAAGLCNASFIASPIPVKGLILRLMMHRINGQKLKAFPS
jgi:hypothetical protein